MDDAMKNIVEALAAWLRFEIACGRDSVLKEECLALPLVQSAQAQGLSLKHEHPVAPPTGGKQGRPISVDYVFLNRKGDPYLYLEAKFTRLNPREILADCDKLLEQPGSERYLLLAGVDNAGYRDRIGRKGFDFLSVTNRELLCVNSNTKAWATWRKLKETAGLGLANEEGQQARRARWQFYTRLVHYVETEHNRRYAMAGIWQLVLSPGAGRQAGDRRTPSSSRHEERGVPA